MTSVIKDKLFTLNMALDARHMSPTLTALARGQFGERTAVRSVAIEVIRRRNQRCVIRYRLELSEMGAQRAFAWNVIGKVYKAERGEPVFQAMQELWRHGFSRSAADAISIPEPLVFASSLCILFQEEVPGLPMKVLFKDAPEPMLMRRLARTLAKLHQCSLVPGQPWTLQDHLRRCHPAHTFLALACPELEPKIDYIIEKAQRLERGFKPVRCTPIHGDFHLGQVHLSADHAWLIDFDAMGYGDPAADLGNVLVFLKGKTARSPHVWRLIEAFQAEYFSIMGDEIAARIPLYEALTHVRRACKALRVQERGWQRRVQRMVEHGVASIDGMEAHL